MSKSKTPTMWTPFEKALDQAREVNEQALRFARETAGELRHRSERTLKLVRSNIEEAQRNLERQAGRFEFGTLPEVVQTRLDSLEQQLRKRVETLARALDLATTRDVDALRRKLSNLEKRVGELSRESAAA